MEDKRFAHVATNPKFRPIPKNQRKVKIDKRFQSMFKDKRFRVEYKTDKRGRPVNHTSSEDLRRYYELSSEDDSSESESENEVKAEEGKFVKAPKDNETTNDLDEKSDKDKILDEKAKKRLRNLKIDYARGESALFSESSSDDEESDEELLETEELDHKWGELDNDAEQTEKPTYRLAACNMDWDRIRAVDLMVLFNSFLTPGSVIKSVIIYPSEFGKARMKEEEVKGPIELVENKAEENEDENEEGSNYHMEKLRQYQLNRLKYYYAVITFDSASTANKIYTECDGMEYESSAVKLDLRFIPDDMEFDNEPKEVCDKLPEVNKYQPRFFTTTALQQAKVDLTWDETNPDRLEISQKLSSGKLEEISEADLQNYLASSSDEEECKEEKDESDKDSEDNQGENVIDKYKALLMDIEDKEKAKKNKDVEMEISWGIDLKEKTEELVKKKQNNSEDKTPFEKYLDKRKEKRKEKRSKKKTEMKDDNDSDMPSDIDMNDPYFAEEFDNEEFKKPRKKEKKETNNETKDDKQQAELDLLLMNEDEGKKHFSLKKIQDAENESKSKKKRKNKSKKDAGESKVEDDFQVNVADERFSALFNSHHFNIDPTDPHYKKTKGMETLISEKLKRRAESNGEPVVKKVKGNRCGKKDAELSLLVKSVKRKTNDYMNK
ncbi:ESF1 homolog [Leptinotarsa decemlineata]|uniref:ESF1 homolog n=1 Tax=Leptinotarsa decemlineata TaxID=7539 RepID=UPI003D309E1D